MAQEFEVAYFKDASKIKKWVRENRECISKIISIAPASKADNYDGYVMFYWGNVLNDTDDNGTTTS